MDSAYSYVLLVLWGLMNSVIFTSVLVGLLSPLQELSVWAKLFLLSVAVGTVTRAYGFWTGVKFSPNVWDILMMFGITGMSVRLAIRGGNALAHHGDHHPGEIIE